MKILIFLNLAHSQGDTTGYTSPHTNLVALSRNLQNVKVRHVDQPTEKRATPYRINVLPLLNRRGW